MDLNVPRPAEYRSRHAAEDIRQSIENNENEIKRLRHRLHSLQEGADPTGFFWLKDELQGLKCDRPLYERELLNLIPERDRLKQLYILLCERFRDELRKEPDMCRQLVSTYHDLKPKVKTKGYLFAKLRSYRDSYGCLPGDQLHAIFRKRLFDATKFGDSSSMLAT